MPGASLGKKSENMFRKLTRLFRHGPSIQVRAKFDQELRRSSNDMLRSSAAYLRNSLTYNSYMNFGSFDRLTRYSDFANMEYMPEINAALDIYADEVTCMSDGGEVLKVFSSNNKIREELEDLFLDRLNIEFNLWTWIRQLCKFGDVFLFNDVHPTLGVIGVLPIPTNEVERFEGFDQKDPYAVKFRWNTQNKTLENWQVTHFRMLGNDQFFPYGASIIEGARRIWRQLILLEDAMLVYRIIRSPERRVFYVDVGNIPADEIPSYMEKVKTQVKRAAVSDQSAGRVDLRYSALSTEDDFFIPSRGDRSSRIDTLSGGQFTGDIEDIEYLQRKLFAALKIPKAFLGFEEEINSKSTLSMIDIRFAKTVQRIQRVVLAELSKIAVIHLYVKGYEGSDLLNFDLRLNNPSTIEEQQRLEIWRQRLEIANSADQIEGAFSNEWVYKQFFNLSDEDIAEIRKQMITDTQFAAYLEKVAAKESEEEEESEFPESRMAVKKTDSGNDEMDWDYNAMMGERRGGEHRGGEVEIDLDAPKKFVDPSDKNKKRKKLFHRYIKGKEMPDFKRMTAVSVDDGLGDPFDKKEMMGTQYQELRKMVRFNKEIESVLKSMKEAEIERGQGPNQRSVLTDSKKSSKRRK